MKLDSSSGNRKIRLLSGVFIALSAVFISLSLFFGCQRKKLVETVVVEAATKVEGAVEMACPIQEYFSLDALRAALSFPLKVPTLSAGYVATGFVTILEGSENVVVEVVYVYGTGVERIKGAATYRMGKGLLDVSGDFSVYAVEETVLVGNLSILFKGNGEGMELAIWNDGSYCYSFSVAEGLFYSVDDFIAIIGSVR